MNKGQLYDLLINNIKLVIFILLPFISCNTKSSSNGNMRATNKTYTCSMHPQIIRNEPGRCPICGMQLVEKIGERSSSNASDKLDTEIIKPVYQTVVSHIPTINPEQKKMSLSIQADGYIAYDTRTEKNISSRYSGRIEKLYVKYMYQSVKKGDILFDIYSPELVTEQRNLIFLINNDPNAQTLIDASKKKLILLGMTGKQIDRLVNTQKPLYQISVYSPYSGHIHQNNPADNTIQNSMPSNMDELSLKEGMYIQRGQTIFNILDTEHIWAMVKIYANDLNKIKPHQSIELTVEDIPERKISRQIDFIEPIINNESRMSTVRVYLDNYKHDLKVGMLLKASIDAGQENGLWIPTSAIFDLGRTVIVWLKKNNVFEARKVKTGITVNNLIQILDGLKASDEIASDAHYLVDSESFIKEN